jgi:two-component system CheB/CheR fusion protein
MITEYLANTTDAVADTIFGSPGRRVVESYENEVTRTHLREALAREELLRQERDELVRRLGAWQEIAANRIAGLTFRERQIMELVLLGAPNKNIAADLGISQRTVENHRASVMKKTGSKCLPALARLALAAVWSDIPVARRQPESRSTGKSDSWEPAGVT